MVDLGFLTFDGVEELNTSLFGNSRGLGFSMFDDSGVSAQLNTGFEGTATNLKTAVAAYFNGYPLPTTIDTEGLCGIDCSGLLDKDGIFFGEPVLDYMTAAN